MLEALRTWVAVGLTTLGLLVMTAAVYGMLWMPGLYISLHAASKAAYLGVIPVIVAVALLGNLAWVARAVLIAAFLLLTTTVSGHAIARAAYSRSGAGAADGGEEGSDGRNEWPGGAAAAAPYLRRAGPGLCHVDPQGRPQPHPGRHPVDQGPGQLVYAWAR